MQVTLTIPDELAAELIAAGKDPSRTALEALTAYQRLLDMGAEGDVNEGIRQGLEELSRAKGVRPQSSLPRCARNMAYLVRTMPRAERDLQAIFGYIGGLNSPPARSWFDGLVASIAGLSEHPQRHPAIPENPTLRHLLYGNKPHIYRYSIDMARQRVEIVHIRHHARDAFKPAGTRQ